LSNWIFPSLMYSINSSKTDTILNSLKTSGNHLFNPDRVAK
jgi:hypothetical protein